MYEYDEYYEDGYNEEIDEYIGLIEQAREELEALEEKLAYFSDLADEEEDKFRQFEELGNNVGENPEMQAYYYEKYEHHLEQHENYMNRFESVQDEIAELESNINYWTACLADLNYEY